MAKFGLSDSEESDSDQQYSTTQSPPPPSRRSTSRSYDSQQEEEEQATDEDMDQQEEEEDEAPPRASLFNEQDQTTEDEGEEEEDHSMASSSRRASTALYSATHSPSSSAASSSSATPPPPPAPATRQRTQDQPWAAKLKLEPKRVAVMQASLFQQQDKVEESTTASAKDSKQKQAIASFASRPGVQPAASPFASRAAPTPTVPAPPIDPSPFRPYRTYSRVPLSQSITAGKEGNLVDMCLALGRSFRVGWGPSGEIAHLGGGLYEAAGSGAKADEVKVDKLRMLATSDTSLTLRTLALQLAHTPIYTTDSNSIPFAVPHPELRFHHFVAALPAHDRSPEAHLWRLGQALFDEIEDVELPYGGAGEDEMVAGDGPQGRYLEELRRRDRLEKWLEDVVRGEVEDDLRETNGKAAAAKRVFALLSGHQIERACEAALEAGDLRLATLVAQAGGDDEFREDLYLQLAKWREYRVDSHIAPAYRRVYELLCGNVGVSAGRSKGDVVDGAEEFHVAEGLGWRRSFGLHLWYGTFQTPVATAVERYEAALTPDASPVAPPRPDYLASPSSPTWANRTPDIPSDPLFQLIKLYTSPTHSLESSLLPRNFGTSPLDYRLPWHLYILFSRVLRRRDFEDRVAVDEEDMQEQEQEGVEGNSVRADLMTQSYARQLELMGLWEWSAFVLLHLELPEGRQKAIRDLLTRNAAAINDEHFTFLTETLKLPPTWIYAAQAIAERYNGDLFSEYKLLMAAEQWSEAHEIVVNDLAPEAVIRSDLTLLRRLFEPLDERKIASWDEGGRTFLDYVLCLEQQVLHQHSQRMLLSHPSSSHHPSASAAEQETARARRSQLLSVIDAVQALAARKDLQNPARIKLKVCVAEMQSRLTVISHAVDEYLARIQPSSLQEADRLVWLAGANSNFLANSLKAACAA